MLKPNCPICENKEDIFSLDILYFGILENDQNILNHLKTSPNHKNRILKLLRPPGLNKQPIWLIIAPDILVSIFLFFFLIISIFNLLDGKQIGLQFSILTIILFSLFLVFRKRINGAFQKQKIIREEIVNQTAKKIDLWSSLWICLKDKIIFNSEHTIKMSYDKFQDFISIAD
jgi:hypothetical protein